MNALAIYHYFGFDLSMQERFALIKSAGFDAVGLWRGDYFPNQPCHRKDAERARKEGLLVIDGHAPFSREGEFSFSHLLWHDTLDAVEVEKILTDTVIAAGEDGVENLIIHTTNPQTPPPNEIGSERVKRLTETAGKNGVVLALENMRSSLHLSYLFDRIDSPNLKFCYDSGHNNCFEPGVDVLSLFGDRLAALHLHDNNGSGGDQHRIPFHGSIDWFSVINKIAKSGYAGATTLECAFSGGQESPEEYLRSAYDAAKRLDQMRDAALNGDKKC
jgi:sugar phosphate isomerase/epimerase